MQREARTLGRKDAVRVAAVAIALLINVAESIGRQTAGNEWIGQRVVQKRGDFTLRIDNYRSTSRYSRYGSSFGDSSRASSDVIIRNLSLTTNPSPRGLRTRLRCSRRVSR